MSLIAFILAVVLMAPQSSAPEQTGPAVPPELTVSSFQWGRVVKKIYSDRYGTVTQSPYDLPRMSPRRLAQRPAIFTQRETHMLVRNMGARTVKNITWSYVFYEDAAQEKELHRVRFETKEKIEPGQMKFVAESVEESAPSPYGAVVIERLEFEDGTSWARPTAK